jgi:hypothetical protein
VTEQCFEMRDSKPSVCGVHGAPLIEKMFSIDPNAPELGSVTCRICAVSRAVIREKRESGA